MKVFRSQIVGLVSSEPLMRVTIVLNVVRSMVAVRRASIEDEGASSRMLENLWKVTLEE